jgi:ketosteroid isomerase-like protein
LQARALFQPVFDRYFDACTSHDAGACAAEYTADGQVFSPCRAPATGSAAIRALHEDWFQMGDSKRDVSIMDAHVDGQVGFCSLVFSVDIDFPDGVTGTVLGSSLNTLLKQPDGSWKIRHTSFNTFGD